MNIDEIRQKAVNLGIEPGEMKKAELIWAVQKAEGFTACFGSGKKDCPYTDCCFRSECIEGGFGLWNK